MTTTPRIADPAGRPGTRRLALLLPVLLSACGISDRLQQIGQVPPLTPIQNPATAPGYQPVSLPMPVPEVKPSAGANSLWRSGARAFFKDQRARAIGDVLTVNVTVSDKAQLSNETSRSRKNSEDMGVSSMFGVEDTIRRALPGDPDPENFVGIDSAGASKGNGSVSRDEQIKLAVAAVVTQVLPNGNLVIQGRQEIRVNFEVRELYIAGVIRPEDITSQNMISHDKIAELRVAYGGRGQLTDVQQPRYGQQALDILLPF